MAEPLEQIRGQRGTAHEIVMNSRGDWIIARSRVDAVCLPLYHKAHLTNIAQRTTRHLHVARVVDDGMGGGNNVHHNLIGNFLLV
eukprot:COSAG02_NODE_1717_length_11210_cov_6.149401_6_plen_85_part_00